MYYFIKFYTFWYNMATRLRNTVLGTMGPIKLVYHFDNYQITNITLYYLTGIFMKQYSSGTYHVKLIGPNQTDHIIFDGHIDDVKKCHVIPEKNDRSNSSKRKNVVLMKDDNTLNANLHMLDNYKNNMDQFDIACTTNLRTLLILLFGLECSHISIMQMMPFKKQIHDVDKVTIDMIYE